MLRLMIMRIDTLLIVGPVPLRGRLSILGISQSPRSRLVRVDSVAIRSCGECLDLDLHGISMAPL